MNVFLLRLLRSKPLSSLLILLMVISCIALCFSAAYHAYVQGNATRLADEYTTIAVLNMGEIYNFPQYGGMAASGYQTMRDTVLSAYAFAQRTTTVKLDPREMLRGVVDEGWPVLSHSFDRLAYRSEKDRPRNMAAMIATCTDIEWLPSEHIELYTSFSTYFGECAKYRLTFSVDETLLIHPGYGAVNTVFVTQNVFTESGDIPFVMGEQYLIYGDYQDVPVVDGQISEGLFPKLSLPNHMQFAGYESFKTPDGKESLVARYHEFVMEKEINGQADTVVCFSDQNVSTLCIPIQGNRDAVTRENPLYLQWLEAAQRNVASAYVLTTDCIGSILPFHQNTAWMIEGREFSNQEVADGKPVCAIHKNFAIYNDLQVGDRIRLNLYEAVLSYNASMMIDSMGFTQTDRSRGDAEFEIVGIYTAPESDNDMNQLSSNTIIVPSNSIPVDKLQLSDVSDELERRIAEIRNEESKINPLLFTVIIPSENLEAFLVEAKEAGADRYLLTHDQGYVAMREPMKRLIESARTMLAVSIALLAVICLVLTVLILRERRTFGLFLSLGVKPTRAVRQHLAGWLVLILPALVIGGILTTLSFDALKDFTSARVVSQAEQDNRFSAGYESDTENGDLLSRFEYSSHVPDIAMTAAIQLAAYLAIVACTGILYTRCGAFNLLRVKE